MIRIGIAGYGNLARGVEAAVMNSKDLELKAVFTRRKPEDVRIACGSAGVFPFAELESFAGELDVVVNCGGSAFDLPMTTPRIAEHFHVIDSFDTHARIPEHFRNVDAQAKKGGKLAVISVGWDPGLFSAARLYMNAVLPAGKDYTFWGRGVSQGHSDAIRRIEGVKDAKQYTVPSEEALRAVRSGETPELTARQKHTRECFVVPEEGADLARIEEEIRNMPHYFAEYDTSVTFLSEEELARDHAGMPHGGCVIRTGETGLAEKAGHRMEFSLKLGSNPEFTGSVLAAYARAAFRMAGRGETGCRTVFDVPPALLFPGTEEELRAKLL